MPIYLQYAMGKNSKIEQCMHVQMYLHKTIKPIDNGTHALFELYVCLFIYLIHLNAALELVWTKAYIFFTLTPNGWTYITNFARNHFFFTLTLKSVASMVCVCLCACVWVRFFYNYVNEFPKQNMPYTIFNTSI